MWEEADCLILIPPPYRSVVVCYRAGGAGLSLRSEYFRWKSFSLAPFSFRFAPAGGAEGLSLRNQHYLAGGPSLCVFPAALAGCGAFIEAVTERFVEHH